MSVRRFIQAEGVREAAFDSEIILLDPRTSQYYGVSGSARRIWGLLKVPLQLDEVVASLEESYVFEGCEETTEQIERFLGSMQERGLIRVLSE